MFLVEGAPLYLAFGDRGRDKLSPRPRETPLLPLAPQPSALGNADVAGKNGARNELATYIERRPYDPEGLYYLGQALEGLGQLAEAREMYKRAVEAARTAPRYRRPFTARWSRLAQKAERKLRS